MVKPFATHDPAGLLKLLVMPLDEGGTHLSLSTGIPRQAGFQGKVEEKYHARHTAFVRQGEQVLSRVRGQSRRIHHAQPIRTQSFFHNGIEQRECLFGKTLVPIIVRNQGTAMVRGDNLRGTKVFGGEG
jgi:hypothetical protein